VSSEPQFTGPTRLEPLHSFGDTGVRISRVSFTEGATTHWHTHRDGQFLYVVSGRCRTQVRSGEVEILGPGESTTVGAGAEHWHGATDDGPMTHLAISHGEVDWGAAPSS
jgi:quercetin dioxygenase-like cupin family protein